MLICLFFCIGLFCLGQNEASIPPTKSDLPGPGELRRDSTLPLTIRNVTITGYKQTKPFIVERELAVHQGDILSRGDLQKHLRLTKEQLMNTTLFVDVIVTSYEIGNSLVDVVVEVKERWYIFPVPYFKVVDRNWNVWINEHNASLDRAEIGMKVNHNNVTGLNDKLNMWVIGGYTQQVSFNYFRPYFDKKLRFGYNVGFSYARNREVNYASAYNKLLTTNDGSFNRKYYRAEAGLSYREGSKLRMQLRFAYTGESFDSIIAKLNPDFIGSGGTKANYLDVNYAVQYYNVDYIPFPLRGWYVDVSATTRFARQSSLDMFQVGGKFLSSWPIANKTWFTFQAAALFRYPEKLPYYNSKLLGFGDLTMQGLEYYVVDGSMGGMLRGTVRRKIYEYTIRNLFKAKSHNEIPFKFYAKLYGNLGYVYAKDPGTSFMNNKLLKTYGFGLDIVTIYDWIIKLEFSFNQFDSGGKLYLHTQSDF